MEIRSLAAASFLVTHARRRGGMLGLLHLPLLRRHEIIVFRVFASEFRVAFLKRNSALTLVVGVVRVSADGRARRLSRRHCTRSWQQHCVITDD